MKRKLGLISIVILLSMVFGLISCSSAMGGGGFYGSPDYGESSPDGSEPTDKDDDSQQVTLPAGLLTAGACNDNDYYTAWLSLFAQEEADEQGNVITPAGKFYAASIPERSMGFNSLNRVLVSVTSAGLPVAGAKVVAFDASGMPIFSAVSDAKGKAYLFVNDESGTIQVNSGEGSASCEFNAQERELSVELDSCGEKLNVIEIMFVVDVTGSMGDELRFLKAELADVIRKIAQTASQTSIKLAFLFYRDDGDAVPFYYCDFTEVTNELGMAKMQAALSLQNASGGGDYPEAVDQALEKAVSKQWSTGNTTKLIFHVLDAPIHSGSTYEKRFSDAVISAAAQGIRICPIISSGAAGETEYISRQAAIYTGGTFIFLTDDSGIGNAHHDPNIPNIVVELLNSMLVRIIKGYHTGVFEEPVYWKDDPGLATWNK